LKQFWFSYTVFTRKIALGLIFKFLEISLWAYLSKPGQNISFRIKPIGLCANNFFFLL
jgi:hypothetical protein